MFTALASLLTNRTVRSDTAMTGEISLRGLVLPVGGIKEKVVAAAAAGLTRVMLPARNRRDFDDIPQGARDKLEFVWLERVDDAIAGGTGGEKNVRGGGRISGACAIAATRDQSMMATARVQPADARSILTGKHETAKPVGGNCSRLCSFSI